MKKYKIILENGTAFVIQAYSMSVQEDGARHFYNDRSVWVAAIPPSACIYETSIEISENK